MENEIMQWPHFRGILMIIGVTHYQNWTSRHFGIPEHRSQKIFEDIIEELYENASEYGGQFALIHNPIKAIEKVGMKHNIKYLRQSRLKKKALDNASKSDNM